MIISTCMNCGREHTTHEFINSCEKCRGNIEVRQIIEPRALSIETRLLIAQEKQKHIIEAAFSRYIGLQNAIFEAQDNNAPAAREQQLRDEYTGAKAAYEAAENRMADIQQALADLKHIEEIAGAA